VGENSPSRWVWRETASLYCSKESSDGTTPTTGPGLPSAAKQGRGRKEGRDGESDERREGEVGRDGEGGGATTRMGWRGEMQVTAKPRAILARKTYHKNVTDMS
jgi:hypothetical protein